MKRRIAALAMAVCMILSITAVSGAEGTKFVTIQEWIDAGGDCGDCMLLLKVKTILMPVLAIAEDETGTIALYSAIGEDDAIVNFMSDEGLAEGSMLVIANPKWIEYEGTTEMMDWTVLRIMPALDAAAEE